MKNKYKQMKHTQYQTTTLYENILEQIISSGVDKKSITTKHTSAFDEFHVRGREVTKGIFNNIELNDTSQVLDIGCGPGGTCRMIAEKYNCDVTGIDITEEYIRTAKKLSKLTKTDKLTSFLTADANKLPFINSSFNLIITQHVQMNIEDKERFYSEISRTIRSGGRFVYYDIFKAINDNNISYPLPWADNREQSFMAHRTAIHNILASYGFIPETFTNQTQDSSKALQKLLTKIADGSFNIEGQKLFMGDDTINKLTNLFNQLNNGTLEMESAVWIKTAL
jgi:ubiquinone/menaquinone biosynthesis C-methylase UbiE